MLNERSLAYYSDTKARKRDEENDKRARIQSAIMKHGKKRYKDFVDSDGHKKPKEVIKDKRGIRALHKGKWGYMKNRKFTADK
tara:strand:+ start:56 stop:304 length:249 start_codon:yes stop_codon:yes gene_type:complete